MPSTSSPSGTNVSSTSSLPRITPYCVVNFDFCRYGDHEFNEVHLFGEGAGSEYEIWDWKR
ncbi:hypothetical protein HBI04_098170 [Parastagonospora nodorum]|nr:hypothetical protein HBI03_199890 [Parastagonospora nodorum]KAH4277727.1 hypothetical protein HBI04_098170 [Parastagonospora nodorum]KAH4804404.1 hypothetical protein HBH61_175920 [Parastagonospora nodorum]KAH5179522.1 hypothetical protein HBH76_179740 [Parastagonospora nodorum]KAH5222525.1 hypothetical protein HBI62_129540 [Parastagonospora nodorum]